MSARGDTSRAVGDYLRPIDRDGLVLRSPMKGRANPQIEGDK